MSVPRLHFDEVPERYRDGYTGRACARGDHDVCPGGFGIQVGWVCGQKRVGGGPSSFGLYSDKVGAPCACTCHADAP